jgi:hypothetical protein
MRGTVPVLIVLCIGVAGLMLGGAGFHDAWGAPSPQTGGAQGELNKSASDLQPANRPDNDSLISGPVSSADSSIVGLIASGLGSIVNAAGSVVFLPVTLVNLGFPTWFAYPLGSIAYIVVGISVIEFATNREWT